MFEPFINKIKEKITLTQADEELIASYLTQKKIRKRQFFLQEGEVSKHSAFVTEGILRSYTVDDKGNEHTIQFALEGWTVADMHSFVTGEPAIYNIEALEDTTVLLINKSSQEEMLTRIPKMERYLRLQMQGAYIAMQRRLIANLSLTAEDKYKRLVDIYPDIIMRVPQHMIASYLGVTKETLSRVRKEMSMRKS